MRLQGAVSLRGEYTEAWCYKSPTAEQAAALLQPGAVNDARLRDVLRLPPIRYLTGWRIHAARDLLASTDLSVATIARRVGYESDEAFSRLQAGDRADLRARHAGRVAWAGPDPEHPSPALASSHERALLDVLARR